MRKYKIDKYHLHAQLLNPKLHLFKGSKVKDALSEPETLKTFPATLKTRVQTKAHLHDKQHHNANLGRDP